MRTTKRVAYVIDFLSATDEATLDELRARIHYAVAILDGREHAWQFLSAKEAGDLINISLDKPTQTSA